MKKDADTRRPTIIIIIASMFYNRAKEKSSICKFTEQLASGSEAKGVYLGAMALFTGGSNE